MKLIGLLLAVSLAVFAGACNDGDEPADATATADQPAGGGQQQSPTQPAGGGNTPTLLFGQFFAFTFGQGPSPAGVRHYW